MIKKIVSQLPGFRSNKRWKKIVSIVLYVCIVLLAIVLIGTGDSTVSALDNTVSRWQGVVILVFLTREVKADIVCLDNQTLFDSRKFETMGDFGKVMEDQFLSLLAYVAEQERKKNRQRQAEGIEVAKAD